MKDLTETIRNNRLIPVIKINDNKQTLHLIEALVTGGISIAEITFRTALAPVAIETVRTHREDVLVGAGTVLNVKQAQEALQVGAQFIVSPGFNPDVVDFCLERKIPVIPGVSTPTEVEAGMAKGLSVLKFFPAEISGGVGMLKALGSVYDVQFMPTGGISEKNLLSYLSLKNVLACGGSWMVKPELIDAGKFDEIQAITHSAVQLLQGLRQ
jgi:2-dehydro-3-deoxyphosphogluconate aldolase/(4S)-4-hydroxy-2-oxoglutarate aldolase